MQKHVSSIQIGDCTFVHNNTLPFSLTNNKVNFLNIIVFKFPLNVKCGDSIPKPQKALSFDLLCGTSYEKIK